MILKYRHIKLESLSAAPHEQHEADAPNSKGLFMKRLAFGFALAVGAASAALAADLPTPGPIPPPIYAPAIIYNWTGLYVGGNLGVGWNGGSFPIPSEIRLALVPIPCS